ncbi:MAG: hypothetical protein LBB59_03035 [Campylobacteraceae bacterium]|nr:hypothetical protein [Campylobacteraceae bacterium]
MKTVLRRLTAMALFDNLDFATILAKPKRRMRTAIMKKPANGEKLLVATISGRHVW